MRITDLSFRKFDRQFIVIWDKQIADIVQESYSNHSKANSLILLGYIDHECGLSFAFACYAHKNGEVVMPLELEDASRRVILRFGFLKECEFDFLPKGLVNESMKTARQISESCCDQDDFVISFRNNEQFDSVRAAYFPDDIKVFLIGDDQQTEEVWCRVERYNSESQKIVCKLLNAPFQNYRIQKGDYMEIMLTKLNDQIVFYWEE